MKNYSCILAFCACVSAFAQDKGGQNHNALGKGITLGEMSNIEKSIYEQDLVRIAGLLSKGKCEMALDVVDSYEFIVNEDLRLCLLKAEAQIQAGDSRGLILTSSQILGFEAKANGKKKFSPVARLVYAYASSRGSVEQGWQYCNWSNEHFTPDQQKELWIDNAHLHLTKKFNQYFRDVAVSTGRLYKNNIFTSRACFKKALEFEPKDQLSNYMMGYFSESISAQSAIQYYNVALNGSDPKICNDSALAIKRLGG